MFMRANPSALIGLILVGGLLCACQTESQREAERRRVEQDRNSAAFKAGQAAHQIAKEAAKVGAAAARKLDESARKAREGWKEQARKEREQE
jgi:hypothetical protein